MLSLPVQDHASAFAPLLHHSCERRRRTRWGVRVAALHLFSHFGHVLPHLLKLLHESLEMGRGVVYMLRTAGELHRKTLQTYTTCMGAIQRESMDWLSCTFH